MSDEVIRGLQNIYHNSEYLPATRECLTNAINYIQKQEKENRRLLQASQNYFEDFLISVDKNIALTTKLDIAKEALKEAGTHHQGMSSMIGRRIRKALAELNKETTDG